ncbi:radical SAM/SPASM domain-containing protein [Pseudomarimonas arenosa]|uniref:SPASM domain-containing protein n=1 Tax=Pseudomarimonas arenosa TaxID=2774145 RepID=A0AAW3ZPL7_9GAMM|nr:SPASM domain-containing protein [Pseudomarimonas arenosa]MBD8526271.1 SPASM domain-containing protein [Pseudomarimonas arenosa]
MPLSPEHGLAARSRAERAIAASRPQSAHGHLFQGPDGAQLLVCNASQLFDIADQAAQDWHQGDDIERSTLLSRWGVDPRRAIDDRAPEEPPLHALSLAVAQRCNLGCQYCYAQQGGFGAAPKAMSLQVAQRSVDRLLTDAAPLGKANLAFMGGEPLANRSVLHATTAYAAERAAAAGIALSFSITSNGTLIRDDDIELFQRHRFAVTISLDGDAAEHDRLRPFPNGQGSYARILQRIEPLLARQGEMQVSARVTVTPHNLPTPEGLDAMLGLGFHSVGYSPMLHAPNGQMEMGADDLRVLLGQMIACAEHAEQQLAQGRRYAFANLMNALRELGRGTHRPYPCGAGAGYLGVDAEGQLAACHRFVGDSSAVLGDIEDGIDRGKQANWLRQRHVHAQSPCSSCWARYLCGGGCHHEVIARGRPACDYIRGWLLHCLGAWLRLNQTPRCRPSALAGDSC